MNKCESCKECQTFAGIEIDSSGERFFLAKEVAEELYAEYQEVVESFLEKYPIEKIKVKEYDLVDNLCTTNVGNDVKIKGDN